jgi:membrane fusion protein (multidrug efflux system)
VKLLSVLILFVLITACGDSEPEVAPQAQARVTPVVVAHPQQRDIAHKQLEQHQYMESKTRIVAPLDGLVTRRHISPGDYVTAGQPLFDLVTVDRLRARIAFPEQDAARIAVGKEVHLTTPASPGVMVIGEVAAVNPQIKVHNRAVEISVEFDNPGGWLPGASTDATLVVERREQALTVPLMAIVTRDGREVVFVSLSLTPAMMNRVSWSS